MLRLLSGGLHESVECRIGMRRLCVFQARFHVFEVASLVGFTWRRFATVWGDGKVELASLYFSPRMRVGWESDLNWVVAALLPSLVETACLVVRCLWVFPEFHVEEWMNALVVQILLHDEETKIVHIIIHSFGQRQMLALRFVIAIWAIQRLLRLYWDWNNDWRKVNSHQSVTR